ncbi:hypothetical protein DICPUDRAFT_73979 [Dictyostelium purpureum]|uniref:RING-type domain-containing protein n=1 Tax=Dictyostelium purpureum TaxID=5786 RepID=F0Z6F3_DICPU|nr:uncharacterized protein DICPUDRAFT_73979 [Dictyostelium purpureum]EGC40479.1 hypothetical protein DICPUDRAFT_73979 [Dictyostelium purpureum]|eukprot:XP_003283026.1 hypothetical protein DICPUDRAFT_73979 [Dictyostelium purpureum]
MEVLIKGEKRIININNILSGKETDIKEQLICKICQSIMMNPVQFCESGHVFCKECLTKWLQKNVNLNSNSSMCCPTCRQVYYYKPLFIEQNNFTMNQKYLLSSNNEIKRKINKIKVHCPYYFKNDELKEIEENNDNGCREIIRFGDVANHIETCEYRFITCSSQNNGCKDLRYKDKDNHYESCPYITLQCSLCNSDHLRKDEEEHLAICPNVKVPCKFCSSNIERNHLIVHYTECPDYLIECEFKDYGCNDTFKRCDKEVHLSQYRYHYDFNLKKINALSTELEKFKIYYSKKIIVFEKVNISEGKKSNIVSISKSLFGQHCMLYVSKKEKYSHFDVFIKSNNKTIFEGNYL